MDLVKKLNFISDLSLNKSEYHTEIDGHRALTILFDRNWADKEKNMRRIYNKI